MRMEKAPKNLLIISDSTMCYEEGTPYAFGPVVVEVQYFLKYFDKITWIGGAAELNPTFYELPSDRVRLKILPSIKAKGWKHKLGVLFNYPRMFRMLKQEIRKHEAIHVRAPSHPAMAALLLAKRYPSKRFWFKYAGSWVDPASKMYDLQRKRLKRLPNHCVVTINGTWPDQPKNILAFENPCLTPGHRKRGLEILAQRRTATTESLDFCFVGGFNSNKGIVPLLQAWSQLKDERLGTLHLVGEGPLLEEVQALATQSNLPVKLHGLLSKEEVHALYGRCFAVVLPTKTEGFPKVIGEAMNYGCIPIVSDVSCIGQYIQTGMNGVLLKGIEVEEIKKEIERILELTVEQRAAIRQRNFELAEKFTYEYYLERVKKDIFTSIQINQKAK